MLRGRSRSQTPTSGGSSFGRGHHHRCLLAGPSSARDGLVVGDAQFTVERDDLRLQPERRDLGAVVVDDVGADGLDAVRGLHERVDPARPARR